MESNQEMDRLIQLVNKIQSACSKSGLATKLDLPQIVVVGGQSAGKSSVLESIVGQHFLPRGKGIVTRCPLVLQLNPCNEDVEEHGVFSHCPKERFESFDAIREEIENQTKVLCPDNSISDKTIVLELFLHHTLSLSLVDLPGLVVNVTEGQSKDIIPKIKNLVKNMIKNKHSIILAVSPANNDIATSVGLEYARKVDPEGKRTVGVLTKVDLIERGNESECIEVLSDQKYALRPHGFYAVKCRGHEETVNGAPISLARVEEQRYFEENEQVFGLVKDRCGTLNLVESLSKTLGNHVKASLPFMKQKISLELDCIRKEKAALRLDDIQIGSISPQVARSIVEQMGNQFCSELEGGQTYSVKDRKNPLNAGAKLNVLLHKTFQKMMEDVPIDMPSNVELNEGGLWRGGLPSDKILVPFIEQNLEHLKKPVKTLLEDLLTIVRDLLAKIVSRIGVIPEMHHKARSIASTLTSNYFTALTHAVENMLNAEKVYVDMNCKEMQLSNELTTLFRRTKNAGETPFHQELARCKHEMDSKAMHRQPIYDNHKIKMLQKLSEQFPETPVLSLSSPILKYFAGTYDGIFEVDKEFLELAKHAPSLSEKVMNKFRDPKKLVYEVAQEVVEGERSEDEDQYSNDGSSERLFEGDKGNEDMEIEEDFSGEEEDMFNLFRMLIDTYVRVSRRTLLQTIPKAVVLHFINPLREGFRNELLDALPKTQEELDALFRCSSDFRDKKLSILEKEKALNESLSALNRIVSVRRERKRIRED